MREYPALAAARDFSTTAIARIRDSLERTPEGMAGVYTTFAAGSLGRLEATALSDVDCVVVLHDSAAEPAIGAAAIDTVLRAITASGLRTPKAAGIYRAPVRVRELIAPAAIGSLVEPPEVFGKRIQVLLDARALHGPAEFDALRARIVEWYAHGFVAREPAKQWTYLLNDLVRYLHSYAAWQQYKLDKTSDDGWFLRHAKLRTSRVLTIASLMFLLGESSRFGAAKGEWLVERLAATPLERIVALFERYDDGRRDELLRTYDRTLALLGDSIVKRELVAASPATLDDLSRDVPPSFAEIHRLSARLMDLLVDFALDRRAVWDRRFYRYWLL